MTAADGCFTDAGKSDFPDPDHYRFLKFVQLPFPAGHSGVRDFLTEGRRVRFVRDHSASEISQAIRVECHRGPFDGVLLGFIPRTDAEKWIPRLDSGLCFAGWIGPEGFSPKRLRIAVYERILFPLNNLSSFEFRQSGLFHPFVSVKLSFREKSLVCRKSAEDSEDAPVQQVSIRFYPKKWDSFVVPSLLRCNFPAWRESYVDPCVCDGVSWFLELRFSSGSRRRILGSNEFPEEWPLFQSFLDQCLDLRDVKGSGSFSILPPAGSGGF